MAKPARTTASARAARALLVTVAASSLVAAPPPARAEGPELQPRTVFERGGETLGRYSDRTVMAGLAVSRDRIALLGARVVDRPFERRLDGTGPVPQPPADAVLLEVALLGPGGVRFTQRHDLRGLCLDHDEQAEAHVRGDTIRLHLESLVVELPALPGFDRLEVAVLEGSQAGLTRRTLGTETLALGWFGDPWSDGVGSAGEQTLGAVHWPEEYGDTDVYLVAGDESQVAKRVNVTVIPDGYVYAEKALMQSHFQAMVSGFRAKTPYGEHDPFVNYILVYAYSTASGTDQCDCSLVVDTAMNTGFPNLVPDCGNSANRCLYYGSRSGTCDSTSIANIAAAELRAPASDESIIMVNTARYGGCGGARAVYSAGTAPAIEVAIHEFGHSFAGLDDEYTSYSSCGSHAGEINTSMNPSVGAWPEWISDLGAPREGAEYYQQCIYRPKSSCEMRSLNTPFCEVCNQRFSLVYFGHFRVAPTAPIESAAPASPVTAGVGQEVTFAVTPRLAVGANVTNSYVWRLQQVGGPDPVVVSTTGPSYVHTFDQPGDWILSCELTADTNFVKPSKVGANRDTATWTIQVQPGAAYTLTVTLDGAGAVVSDPPGIDCEPTCSAGFDAGQAVTLTAAPAGGSSFSGWSGEGCSGTGPCQVTMDAARAVTATFELGLAPVSLDLDLHPDAGTTGNLNGVFEPGEVVSVEPIWANAGAGLDATGTASAFTGPAGADYAVIDGAANYGTLAEGGTAGCHDATGDCYLLQVDDRADRPALHRDATFAEALTGGGITTWTLHLGASFSDVPPGAFGYPFIEALLHSGITAGCSAASYCPSSTLTRWQMAVFLAKALTGGVPPASGTVPGMGDYDCTLGGSSVFDDVPPEDPGCAHVHYLAAEQITAGCSPTSFCPASTLTRWQMAVLLARALTGGAPPASGTVPGLGDYDCTLGGASVFGDVPPEDPGCAHVHYLAAEQITLRLTSAAP